MTGDFRTDGGSTREELHANKLETQGEAAPGRHHAAPVVMLNVRFDEPIAKVATCSFE